MSKALRFCFLFIQISCFSTTLSFASEKRIHGFFIQPALGYGATDYQKFNTQNEYDAWLKSMADVGSEMLFYQWSTHYEHNQTWYSSAYGGASSADFSFYKPNPLTINSIPTRGWATDATWTGTPSKGGKEPLLYTLDAAAKNGVKVWLGLYLNESSNSYNWWSAISDNTITANDSAIIQHHIDRSNAVAKDLITLYGNHPAFGGIYYSIEVANLGFIPPANHPYLAYIIQSVANTVHKASPTTQLAMCPFFNTTLGTPQEFEDMWNYVLKNSDLDILMIQDGVGVDPFTLTTTNDKVTPYIKAIAKAAQQNNVPLWGNAELFTNLGTRESPSFIPTDTAKLKLQIQTLAPYVNKIVSFGFEYLDPNPKYTSISSEKRSKLYNDYKQFYQNWKLTQSTSQLLINRNSSHSLTLNLKDKGNGDIQVFNSKGEQIKVNMSASSPEEFLIDFQSQAQGLYFIKTLSKSASFVVLE